MDFLLIVLLVLISAVVGVIITLAVQWYVFNMWMMQKPYVGSPEKPISSQFCLPQNLIDALQSGDVPKTESCLALNLLFQFLFKELRNAEKVRHWFRKKLSLEFEELLTRTTTGKLFDKVRIRDLHLGKQFPAIKSITVKDATINPEHQHIDTLDLCLDLEYSGGFQLSIDANMLLGKAAFLSVKVNHLSGQARLQFTRHPYTHWSFTFYNEPVLELQVESQFQGRHLSHITSLISSQIRRALRKKHTLPNYKLRYKPFFDKSEPGEEEAATQPLSPGTLEVTIVEVTRLMESLALGDVYCSLAVDSIAWVEMVQSETASFMTLDLIVAKSPSQPLGVVFKQEFVAERYAACVVAETVAPQSPAAAADIRRGDILVAVEGRKVTSMTQAARAVKAAGDRFVLRVERKSSYKLQHCEVDEEKMEAADKDPESRCGSVNDLRMDGSDGLRQRHGSVGEKSESESSNSNPPSLPGSPAKQPVHPARSTQSSPERVLRANFHRNSSTSFDGEEEVDYLQIHKTKKLPANQILAYNEPLLFLLQPKHRYLNVSVWSKVPSVEMEGGARVRAERDKLVGHVSLPLGAVVAQCNASTMGHYLKSYTLLPPDSQTDINRSHKLWGHSGFEPCLCYGDILLSFLYSSSSRSSGSLAAATTPSDPLPPALLMQPPAVVEDSKKQHDFIRTHFNRTTQCEFCAKKIWLKDAVQCRDCAMTCHKKCVSKCQLGTVCVPGSAVRRTANQQPDESSAENSPRRVSIHPEIITTAPAADDGSVTPQTHRRGIGSLLQSVSNAAHARGLKRAGSANNLALPSASDASSQSRSLPPSPQHSPMASRKASLVGNPFQFANTVLEGEAADEMTAVLNHLLERPNDEDLMSVAKSTGKDLYASLPLEERKEKIHAMITKLKSAMDIETTSRMSLAREEQTSKDAAQRTKLAFLIGKSDEKVQALAVLMLHFCSGLQHIQDLEDIANREAELGFLDEDLTIEITSESFDSKQK